MVTVNQPTGRPTNKLLAATITTALTNAAVRLAERFDLVPWLAADADGFRELASVVIGFLVGYWLVRDRPTDGGGPDPTVQSHWLAVAVALLLLAGCQQAATTATAPGQPHVEQLWIDRYCAATTEALRTAIRVAVGLAPGTEMVCPPTEGPGA